MPPVRHAIPVIETARLRLRGFTPADAPAFHAAYGDTASMRHWNHAPSPNLARTEKYLRGWMKCSPSGWMVWAIASRDTDRCLGMINYHSRQMGARRVELGYILTPEARGQGHAGEALGALVADLRVRLKVHRFEAQIEPENAKSRALVERLGFVCEAPLLRDRWRVGDEYRSVALYALITP